VPAAEINRIESRRQSDDCATWALATYLGLPYEVVWQKVLKMDRSKGRNGLYTATVLRIAEALGTKLRRVKPSRIDFSDDYGILSVEDATAGHVVVLRQGLVFDTDATVTPLDIWLLHTGYTVTELLTAA